MITNYKIKFIEVLLIIILLLTLFSLFGFFIERNTEITKNLDTNQLKKLLTHSIIILAFVVSSLVGIESIGFYRTLSLLVITFIVSFTFELSSTYNGFPYGKYEYSDILILKIMDKVPLLIPLSWFSIILPSYLISSKFGFSGVKRIISSTIFVLIWDLSLEYCMSYIYKIWIWEEGFFYTMPIENWGGWILTSLIIYSIYEILFENNQVQYLKHSFYLYIILTMFSSIFCLISGGVIPSLFTFGGVLVIFLNSRVRSISLW